MIHKNNNGNCISNLSKPMISWIISFWIYNWKTMSIDKQAWTMNNKTNYQYRVSSLLYTVVKWGHTEGIEREKTLSQKYTVIALDFWRDEFFLVFQIWGQNIIGGQFLGHYHPRAVYPQILQAIPAEGNALIFWFFYMQKINAKCPQIFDEKKDKFCSFDK